MDYNIGDIIVVTAQCIPDNHYGNVGDIGVITAIGLIWLHVRTNEGMIYPKIVDTIPYGELTKLSKIIYNIK